MPHKYKQGEKVRYKNAEHGDNPLAIFVCYFDGVSLLKYHDDDPNNDQPDFFTVGNHNVQPYYETQQIKVEYVDAYNALEFALNQSYPGTSSIPDLMRSLGFEVQEDEL